MPIHELRQYLHACFIALKREGRNWKVNILSQLYCCALLEIIYSYSLNICRKLETKEDRLLRLPAMHTYSAGKERKLVSS